MSFNLHGYKIKKQIYEGQHSKVYRALRNVDEKPVVLKLLKANHPTEEQLAAFRNEYELLKLLNQSGTVDVFGMEKYQHSLVLILDDFYPVSLQEVLQDQRLTFLEALRLALAIVTNLEKIHHYKIIHKDVSPGNILWNRETNEVKLIDFGMATIISKETMHTVNPGVLEGALYYISPEQTGRMNRTVDYRSDFYSLGVIFYQLFTGILPFDFDEPIEIVHAHIAKIPQPPIEVDPMIPAAVSNIVMRLLAKSAEDRYQSIAGIKADLQNCLEQFQTQGLIKDITLGQYDFSDKFQIPEKIYGREQELPILLQAFDRINHESIELVLVSGYSGIGKSSLIHELYKPIVATKGYFIGGKYDQFKRNVPYEGIKQAIQDLVRQFLSEDEDKITKYRRLLDNALGENARLLKMIVPELEMLLEKQREYSNYSQRENQNRFELAFYLFFKTLTENNLPLVIFLDDLQWADLPSLSLLKVLLMQKNIKKILIVGTYRDNEVLSGHPLNLMLDDIKKFNVNVTEITLNPLTNFNIQELLSDTLHAPLQEVQSLASLCLKKTDGNPFFLHQFLYALHENNAISFDRNLRKWVWNIDIINQLDSTENVIDLVASKIKKLPISSQKIMGNAACLGNQFDLEMLEVIYEKNKQEIAQTLWLAIEEGLIVPIDENYYLAINNGHINASYRFLHDRVQQAAYLLLTEDVKQQLHLKIGRLLLKKMDVSKQEDNLFEIVDHFNCSLNLVTSIPEKKVLSELNFRAGVKAKQSIAYEAALRYLQTAIQLLPDDSWNKNYTFTLNLYNEATETAYILEKDDLTLTLGDEVLQNAHEVLDQMKIYELKMFDSISKNAHANTVKIFLDVTDRLGEHFESKHIFRAIFAEMFKIKLLLLGKKEDYLLNLPKLTDKKILAIAKLAIGAISAGYFVDQNLMALFILKIYRLTLQYGFHDEIAHTFALYAGFLIGVRQKIEQGYRLGQLSLKLIENISSSEVKCYVIWDNYSFVSHWKEPLRLTLDKFLEAYQYALIAGNLEMQANAIFFYCSTAYLTGIPLPKLEEMMKKFECVLKDLDHKAILNLLNVTQQIVDNYMYVSPNPGKLTGKYFDEDKAIAAFKATNNLSSLCATYFTKLTINYYFNNYKVSLKTAFLLEKYKKSFMSTAHWRCSNFYCSLAMLAAFKSANLVQKAIYLAKVLINQKNLKKWAKICPENNLNKYYLVKAELANVLGHNEKAAILYEKAIETADKYEYLQEQALAAELAFRFYLKQGEEKNRIAKVYLEDAIYLYTKWGAMAKVSQLERKYGHMLTSGYSMPQQVGIISQHKEGTGSYNLDLATVIKASQAIAKEIELSYLLKKLMEIVIENAGGQRGFLLLEKNGEWLIESAIEDNKITISSLSPKGVMPLNIISYAIHTKENIIVDDAIHDDKFSTDAYIAHNKPKSILCMPLLNQGSVMGLLYLENNLVAGSFTADRINILNVLSAQIVISIANARLYETLRDTNQAYERFVPKEFLNFLSKKNIIDLQLGDQVKQEMTVMFCDIRNFTARSEKMNPQENFNYINSILRFLEPIISQHGGFIDKYIGDCIMALFPKNAESAIEASLAMLRAMKLYNEQYPHQAPTKVGIGLNTGQLMLGIVGGKQRLQGSVISDAVNIASRIESLTKIYNSSLLISQDTYSRLRNPSAFNVRKVDTVILKGKSKSVVIYEVLDSSIQEAEINSNSKLWAPKLAP